MITISNILLRVTEPDPKAYDYHRSDEQTAIRMECYRYVTHTTHHNHIYTERQQPVNLT